MQNAAIILLSVGSFFQSRYIFRLFSAVEHLTDASFSHSDVIEALQRERGNAAA